MSRRKYVLAWLAALFLDDGYVRFCYSNFFKVDDHAFRSDHPLPTDFARIRRRGIKSIINLRGDNADQAATALEKVACDKYSIPIYFLAMSSRDIPTIEQTETIYELIQTVEKPFLVHCKSGADRAGMFITLYHIFTYPRMSVADANALRWYYGHFTLAQTGVLDAFVEAWQEYKAEHPDSNFMDWRRHHCDIAAIEEHFAANRWWSRFVDRLLRRE